MGTEQNVSEAQLHKSVPPIITQPETQVPPWPAPSSASAGATHDSLCPGSPAASCGLQEFLSCFSLPPPHPLHFPA